jgi:hypothetical protein
MSGWRDTDCPTKGAVLLATLLLLSACPKQDQATATPDQVKANDALLASITTRTPPWQFDKQYQFRYVEFKGVDDYAKNRSYYESGHRIAPCAKADEAAKRTAKDEFEERDRKQAVQSAIEECFKAATASQTPYPQFLVVELPVSGNEYDFDKAAFVLRLPFFVTKGSLFNSRTEGDPLKVSILASSGQDGQDTSLVWAIEDRHSDMLVLLDSTKGPFSSSSSDDRAASIRLPCSADLGKRLKGRLSGASPRVQIAFKPDHFGSTPITKGFGGNEPGMMGKAIGYRLVDSQGDLIRWTPFGRGADGSEVPPRVEDLSNSTPSTAPALTRAQTARASMSTEQLQGLREELAPMHSANRWPKAQQDHFLKACMKAKEQDPSVNEKMCGCTMEVIMNRFKTAGDYAKYLTDHEDQAGDEELSTMTGSCLAAYGD